MGIKPEFPQRSVTPERLDSSVSGSRLTKAFPPLLVIVALGILVLVVIFLPRPQFHIDQVEFLTTACDPASHSYQVTAAMTIRNAGSVGGQASVQLFVDGQMLETGQYFIGAHETIQRGLTATIADCQWHRFTVALYIPPQSGS